MLYIVAILLPPLAVLLAGGGFGTFILNIILTLLAWIPGVIHAFIVISRRGNR